MGPNAEGPPSAFATPTYLDVATTAAPTPLDNQATFILEADNGRLRLKPQGPEPAAKAVVIHVPPRGVTVEAGANNTVIIHEDHGNGRSSRAELQRALLILPGKRDQAETTRTAFLNRPVEADSSPQATAVTRAEGSAEGGKPVERRLTDVERKLELILKELKGLKGR